MPVDHLSKTEKDYLFGTNSSSTMEFFNPLLILIFFRIQILQKWFLIIIHWRPIRNMKMINIAQSEDKGEVSL